MELIDRDFLLQLLNWIALGKKIEGAPDTMKYLSTVAGKEIPADTPIMPNGVWPPNDLLRLADQLEHNGFEFSGTLLRNWGAADKSFKIPGNFLELYRRVMDELGNMLLMRVPPEKAQLWERVLPCGPKVVDALPTANEEVIEAGNCIAADRNTAAVFHLMRALEIALRCLAKGLGIPDPVKESDRNWGKMLESIWRKIEENNKQPPPSWSEDKEFFVAFYGDLVSVKNAWRNKTMHVEGNYEYRPAKRIYETVSDLLMHAATRLNE